MPNKIINQILGILLFVVITTFSQNITNTLGTEGKYIIKDNSTTHVVVNQSNGRVGIGTTDPQAQLHTTGSVCLAGAGTPGVNKVLTSDSSGNATWQSASQIGAVPPGVIMSFAGSSAPDGYLLCQGQAVSRGTYSSLFAVLGTTYGTGNGSTTFNLPDLRTRVPVGLNSTGTFNALNNKGGSETHTITTSQMPSHNHGGYTNNGTTDGSHSHTASITGYAYGGGGTQNGSFSSGSPWALQAQTVTINTTNSDHRHVIASQGSGNAIPIVQPYIVLNYIIKY